MMVLKTLIAVLWTVMVAFAGMIYQVKETNSHFETHIGIPLSSIYEAKSRCEKLAGEGNCRIVGGFMPKPQRVIVVPPSAQKPQGRDV